MGGEKRRWELSWVFLVGFFSVDVEIDGSIEDKT